MAGIGPQADEDQVRVLIVEDEESYREAMSSGLQVEGYRVELAADGTEGLARFAEHTPDIVLLDVLLPPRAGGPDPGRAPAGGAGGSLARAAGRLPPPT
jgi:CheY-like chemotaxis protein